MRACLMVTVLAVAGQVPASSQGVIEGTVVNALTGEPIKKVGVTLQGVTNQSATTDASGHYAFRDLPAGDCHIEVQQARSSARLVKLRTGERIQDVALFVTPGGAIRGRVVSEDGSPMEGCQISVEQSKEFRGKRFLSPVFMAFTRYSGEYQLVDMNPGKYYLRASCSREIPLPHPFMEAGSEDIPTMSYSSQYYPGSPDCSGANAIVVAPGVDVRGIDFRMKPSPTLVISGRLSGLKPGEPMGVELRTLSSCASPETLTTADGSTGSFRFPKQLPGNYEIVATSYTSSPLRGSAQIAVSTQPGDPVEISVAQLPDVSGAVVMEGGDLPESLQLGLVHVDRPSGESIGIPIKTGGNFVVPGVLPGKWRISTIGSAFVESAALDGKSISSYAFDIPSAGAKDLQIVLSSKWASIKGHVTGLPAESSGVGVIIWSDETDRQQPDLVRIVPIEEESSFQAPQVVPGRYHICAVELDGWTEIAERFAVLAKLEIRGKTLDVSGDENASVQLELVPKADLTKLASEADHLTAEADK